MNLVILYEICITFFSFPLLFFLLFGPWLIQNRSRQRSQETDLQGGILELVLVVFLASTTVPSSVQWEVGSS